MSAPTARAQPFYCPYCGEPDIRPDEDAGVHHCRLCDRRWRLEFRGLAGSAAS
ncbi:MAG: hypothetical protein KY434_02835 [Actinobacteria bacterium]|nr:hypothetical protein [Actinomycetota bacterium]